MVELMANILVKDCKERNLIGPNYLYLLVLNEFLPPVILSVHAR